MKAQVFQFYISHTFLSLFIYSSSEKDFYIADDINKENQGLESHSADWKLRFSKFTFLTMLLLDLSDRFPAIQAMILFIGM